MTVEASPLPFKHQDYTLSALLLPPPFLSPHDAGTPRRRPSGTESKPSQLLVFYAYSLFFSCTIDFFNGEIRGDSCGFCGRTRSSHIFRLDDGARRARVEMGVVFW